MRFANLLNFLSLFVIIVNVASQKPFVHPVHHIRFIICYESCFGSVKGSKFSRRFNFFSDRIANICTKDDDENVWRAFSIDSKEDQNEEANISSQFTGNKRAKFQIPTVNHSILLNFTRDNNASMSTVQLGEGAFVEDYIELLFQKFLLADMPSHGNNNSTETDGVCHITDCKYLRPSPSSPTQAETTNVLTNITSIAPEPVVTSTLPDSNEKCTTMIINAVPAIIRDTLADLPSKCRLAYDPNAKCEFEIDYAVRLGCIKCKPGITKEEQQIFLSALIDWLNANSNEVDKWEGTNLLDCKLSGICSDTETIRKLEPGRYRYISIAEDWKKNGESVNMLIHNCSEYGLFASAYQISTLVNIQPTYETHVDWTKDFEFLEKCEFVARRILDKKVLISEARQSELNGVEYGFGFNFGTFRKNEMKEEVPYSYSPEQVEAHKFKYGLMEPMRQNIFTSEDYNVYERTRMWGRYFLPPEFMYVKKEEHKMVLTFLKIRPSDLTQPGGRGLTSYSEPAFLNAQVHSYANQMVIVCGDIHIGTLRFNAYQKINYQMKGTGLRNTLNLSLRTDTYEIDYQYYFPPDDQQLDDIHLYNYIFQG